MYKEWLAFGRTMNDPIVWSDESVFADQMDKAVASPYYIVKAKDGWFEIRDDSTGVAVAEDKTYEEALARHDILLARRAATIKRQVERGRYSLDTRYR
jgi:hypothetical protein